MIRNLEEKIRRGKLTRRDFLRLGLGGIASLGLGISQACKKSSPVGPSIPVSLSFEVYNHTQGPTGVSFTKTYMSGDQVRINIQDLIKEYGIRRVDKERIAVREEKFGGLIGFSNNKEVIFTAPNHNKNYDIYLFNTFPGLDYNLMDQQDSRLYLNKRNYVAYRKDFDGQTGPEEAWEVVFDQHNQALSYPWAEYGRLTRKPMPNDEEGDFSYGYADCHGWWGCHGGTRIAVNAKKAGTFGSKVSVGNAELFENITSVNNIGGQSSGYLITEYPTGDLNEIGKHLLAYVFVKDTA